MQRHRWNSFGLRIESGSGLFGCFITDDDSLPTRLTYGVKGPHTSSREIEGEVWTAALPQPTSTPAVARTVG
jgi:hypothetical protein